jgi:hypothetical protein
MRVILGAVTRTSLRGIIVARGAQGKPAVWSDPAAGGRVVQRVNVSTKVNDELREHGLIVFSFELTGLVSDVAYTLHVDWLGEAQERPFRTLAAPYPGGELRVVVASCYYDGFGGDAHYAAAMSSTWCKNAHLRLLVGDNLYADIPFGSSFSNDAWADTATRYLEYFWKSGYAAVLGGLPNLATWDDHEFWNNFPERVAWLSRTSDSHRAHYKQAGLECLDTFQSPLNPAGAAGHRSFAFDDAPYVSFFFADARTQRTRHEGDGPRRVMPLAALEALEHWAAHLSRPGVLVVGQPLWLGPGDWKDYNLAAFEREYRRIWTAVARAPRDILIVSGDVHHSRLLELSVLRPDPADEESRSRSVFEFVTSPACHIPTAASSATWLLPDRQDAGTIELPGDVPLSGSGASGLKPEFQRYLFGTDAQNSIGVFVFRDAGQKGVAVDCAFLDGRDTHEFALSKSGRLGSVVVRADPPVARCRATPAFHLK